MNVLHIHDVDHPGTGGGAIVMNRLHAGLKKSGVQSRILCRQQKLSPSESTVIPTKKWITRVEGQLWKVTSRLGLNDIHCLNTFAIAKSPAFRAADLLHLHCIHGGFFNYLALPRLTEHKPAVFTLHDIWPFTGHCAYSYDCDRWQSGCGHCPYPKNYPPIKRDGSALEWKLKKWSYSHSRLVIVSPSSRLTTQAQQSMLRGFQIHQIPHGIDTESYRPLDSMECRDALGLPKNKQVIMFGAAALNAFNKGGDLLRGAIARLPEQIKRQLTLLTFGAGGKELQSSVDIPTLDLGYIDDEERKVIAYSAADLFVQPSRAESFSLVVQESMACGTPVVAFPIGGIVDMVRPHDTGYLTAKVDADDLARVITEALRDAWALEEMGRQCRKVVVEEYSLDQQVRRHVNLYEEILEQQAA